MKRVMVGIFAHPDDEAFGPSGTLLKLKDSGFDIHLVLLTSGEAGTNPGVNSLGETRLEEWRRAATLLQATTTSSLDLGDGKLESIPVEAVTAQLLACVEEISRFYADDTEVELSFITFEPSGLTGHTDHIAASVAASRTFEAVQSGTVPHTTAGSLWYYCLSKEQAPLEETPYYHTQARADDYITHKVDVSDVLERKFQVIDAHATQAADIAKLKSLGDELLSTECFHIVPETTDPGF